MQISNQKTTLPPWKESTEPRDCGASCFASVASFHGHHLTVEEGREVVHTDRTGTSLRWIVEGARSIGFDAQAATGTYESLADAPLPFIAHLGPVSGHYVVVARWSSTGVTVVDPSVGPLRMSRAEFEECWSGMVAVMTPTSHFETKAPVFTERSFFREHRIVPVAGAFAGLLSAASVAVGMLFAQRLGASIDAAIRGDHVSPTSLAVTLLAITAVIALAQFARVGLVTRYAERLEVQLSKRFLGQIGRVPPHEFEERCPVGFGGRIADANQVSMLIQVFGDMVSATLVVVVGALLVAWVSPILAVLLLCGVPFFVAISVWGARRGRIALFGQVRLEYGYMTELMDTFHQFDSVKAHNAEGYAMGSLIDILSELSLRRRKATAVMATPTVVGQALASAITVAVVVASVLAINAGRMTPGDALFSFSVAGFAVAAAQRIPGLIVEWRSRRVHLTRILEVIHKREEFGWGLPERSVADVPHLRFEDVRFSYHPGFPVLDGVEVDVPPGSTVAIVGASGSGKTSIARLMNRFVLPDSGQILIDGVDSTEFSPSQVRELVHVVYQDTRLIQKSMRENLLVAAPGMSDSDLFAALSVTQMNGDVARLREGLDTHAAHAGRNLSAGQGQRLALTRAVLRDSPILILDEATANVDSQTEELILRRLLELRSGRTTILMAHRLSTVRHADWAIVLADGCVAETGPIDGLIRGSGPFSEMFGAQLDEAILR